MRAILMVCFALKYAFLQAQTNETKLPTINVRLSFLVFPPFSPLLTVETRTFQNLTLQVETNFVDTHGVNLKYFIKERMSGSYLFVGTAFIENDFLRKDKKITVLPYTGYGYAHRFGKRNTWIFDSRLGIGRTTNADNNAIYPVLKTGIGRVF